MLRCLRGWFSSSHFFVGGVGEGGERRYLFVFGLDPFWVILGSEEINDINRKYYIYFLKCFSFFSGFVRHAVMHWIVFF